ncbi:DUF4870 domain-containing protein [Rothia nasimurium]|uniref:DUF4870 domain-containing protein n=1 Tax=Rothia nasimurium TaxID=85336 RepID=UPI001F309F14|nr:DUF4870 domain-containing protein [Rothia nasimurium]
MKTATSPKTSSYRGTPATASHLSVTADRNIATAAHFGGVLGCAPAAVIYYLYRGRGPFTEQESREALDFTLLPTLVIVLAILLSNLPAVGGFFGLLAALTWTYLAVSALMAGFQVTRGNPYQYRFNTRLFSTILARRK